MVKDLGESLHVCRMYSADNVSKMQWVPSITFFQPLGKYLRSYVTHSSLCNWEDIFILHLMIIIKSEVQIFFTVILLFRCCVYRVIIPSYSVSCFESRKTSFFVPITTVQSMACANDWLRYDLKVVFITFHITHSSSSSLCRFIWRHCTKMIGIFYMSRIKPIVSILLYAIYAAAFFHLTHFV